MYKVEFANGMIIVSKPFNTEKVEKKWNGLRRSEKPKLNMNRKDYCKTLNRKRYELYKLDLSKYYGKWITLTFEYSISFDGVLNAFKQFMKSIRRNYGENIKYIRAIEVQNTSHFYHIHIILLSEEKIKMDCHDIKKFWQYGFVDIKNIYRIQGLIKYITNYKNSVIQQGNQFYTYFPLGARIITWSQGFKNIEVPAFEIDDDWLFKISEEQYNEYLGEIDFETFENAHYFVNEKHDLEYYWDKIYLPSEENFKQKLIEKFKTSNIAMVDKEQNNI